MKYGYKIYNNINKGNNYILVSNYKFSNKVRNLGLINNPILLFDCKRDTCIGVWKIKSK